MSIYYHDNFPYFLVGGFNPSEKYEFVNGKDDIPYIMENKKYLKPPTSFCPSPWSSSTA
jgi:hypothetical protein